MLNQDIQRQTSFGLYRNEGNAATVRRRMKAAQRMPEIWTHAFLTADCWFHNNLRRDLDPGNIANGAVDKISFIVWMKHGAEAEDPFHRKV